MRLRASGRAAGDLERRRELREHLAAHAARCGRRGALGGDHELREARSPCATAASTAARSAQIVAPYVAFSTLHPTNVRPPAVASAAPYPKAGVGSVGLRHHRERGGTKGFGRGRIDHSAVKERRSSSGSVWSMSEMPATQGVRTLIEPRSRGSVPRNTLKATRMVSGCPPRARALDPHSPPT